MNISLSQLLKISLLLLFCTSSTIQLGHANVVYHSVSQTSFESELPIEKRKKKKKRKKRHRIKKNTKNTESKEITFMWIELGGIITLTAGAFIFGFGIAIPPLFLIGLISMGLGLILAISMLLAIFFLKSNWAIINFEIGSIALFIAAFSIGLAFLIWGLLVSGPLVWILGTVLLGVGILSLIAFFIEFLGRTD
ncbi:MAG: hypothetical protein GY810_23780 [Aureispira sp.]|nr:hypothetical protein [Aureispira sp.]